MITEKKRMRGVKKKTSNDPGVTELYGHCKKDITEYNWLGDNNASRCVRKLLVQAESSPKTEFTELKSAKKEQRLRLIKKRLSQL